MAGLNKRWVEKSGGHGKARDMHCQRPPLPAFPNPGLTAYGRGHSRWITDQGEIIVRRKNAEKLSRLHPDLAPANSPKIRAFITHPLQDQARVPGKYGQFFRGWKQKFGF